MPVTRTRARAEKALALLESLPEESILAVTHGGILRMIIASVIFGKELSHREYHKLLRATVTTNTGITLIEYREKPLVGSPGWKLIAWNDHAHLA